MHLIIVELMLIIVVYDKELYIMLVKISDMGKWTREDYNNSEYSKEFSKCRLLDKWRTDKVSINLLDWLDVVC